MGHINTLFTLRSVAMKIVGIVVIAILFKTSLGQGTYVPMQFPSSVSAANCEVLIWPELEHEI